MEWQGSEIKNIAKEQGMPLVRLADKIGVSRQTVNSWIKGQVPRGNHLLMLCQILDCDPDRLFHDDSASVIVVPIHRKRGHAKVKVETKEKSFELAKEYKLLFKLATSTNVLPVIRVFEREKKNAIRIANRLRKDLALDDGIPIDYQQTFSLLEHLGIHVIFRKFPDTIKSYAFYTEIHKHRVVFVNNATNIIDLIFPLLHEAVHAVRDENPPPENGYHQEEEDFCDMVAGYIQFPDEYVEFVFNMINDLEPGTQVNKLKDFAKKYGHSLYGITKRIKYIFPEFQLYVGGADTNLKKDFPTIGDVLFSENDCRTFIKKYSTLSPNFIRILVEQIDNFSDRKLSEILDLEECAQDGKIVREVLQTLATNQLA